MRLVPVRVAVTFAISDSKHSSTVHSRQLLEFRRLVGWRYPDTYLGRRIFDGTAFAAKLRSDGSRVAGRWAKRDGAARANEWANQPLSVSSRSGLRCK